MAALENAVNLSKIFKCLLIDRKKIGLDTLRQFGHQWPLIHRRLNLQFAQASQLTSWFVSVVRSF